MEFITRVSAALMHSGHNDRAPARDNAISSLWTLGTRDRAFQVLTPDVDTPTDGRETTRFNAFSTQQVAHRC